MMLLLLLLMMMTTTNDDKDVINRHMCLSKQHAKKTSRAYEERAPHIPNLSQKHILG
jgi:hypothetical protein